MTGMKHWNYGIWDVSKKSEFWKVLAKRIDANFRIVTTVSRDLNRMELKFEYEKVMVSFSESDTKPLFVECNFNRDMGRTRFEIYKVDFIEKIASKFSKNKISANNKEFNDIYLTEATDNNKIRSIINNKNITDLILRLDLTYIGGRQDNDGKFNLSLNIHRNINNIEQLEAVYNLTTALIDTLKERKTAVNEELS